MGRRLRNQAEPLCYHLTHRCQERKFLLRFQKDRHNYLMRLHQMARRFPVDVLTYMVTSNHVHLLAWARHANAVSAAMHFLQSTTAADYNRRKKREGAFWRGRYHPTLIQADSHLARCLFYIDLNMVRANVCEHPSDWLGGAYEEIIGQRQRYRIINRQRLMECFGRHNRPDQEMISWYTTVIDEEMRRGYLARQPFWSEALAVGDEQWVGALLPNVRNARVEKADLPDTVCDGTATYAVYASKRDREQFWQRRIA